MLHLWKHLEWLHRLGAAAGAEPWVRTARLCDCRSPSPVSLWSPSNVKVKKIPGRKGMEKQRRGLRQGRCR